MENGWFNKQITVVLGGKDFLFACLLVSIIANAYSKGILKNLQLKDRNKVKCGLLVLKWQEQRFVPTIYNIFSTSYFHAFWETGRPFKSRFSVLDSRLAIAHKAYYNMVSHYKMQTAKTKMLLTYRYIEGTIGIQHGKIIQLQHHSLLIHDDDFKENILDQVICWDMDVRGVPVVTVFTARDQRADVLFREPVFSET